MGPTARWRAFWVLMALALAAMVIKKLTVCSWVRRHNPSAAVSLLGGILGAAGCAVSPSPMVNHLWWAPMALDSMGLPYFLIIISGKIHKFVRRPAGVMAGAAKKSGS
jgi:hypothetical protein